MNADKTYAVLLNDGADDELGKSFGVFIRRNESETYLYAKTVDPEGNYFRMVVDQEILPGEKVEIEIQVHHEFIKGVFGGAEKDLKELGLT